MSTPRSRTAALSTVRSPAVLVLASVSPARRATLEAAGVRPVVVGSEVDEDAEVRRRDLSDPEQVALVLARAKAEDVAGRVDLPAGALVLGCDSVLELDGRVHGKPSGPEEAAARWRAMRGRWGVLHTGHWLVDVRLPADGGSAGALGALASTRVLFADLTDAEVAAYVATGEPLRVAGAFTIDGLGGPYVERIDGDHHTVVGLSLPLLRRMLAGIGVTWHELWEAVPGGQARI